MRHDRGRPDLCNYPRLLIPFKLNCCSYVNRRFSHNIYNWEYR